MGAKNVTGARNKMPYKKDFPIFAYHEKEGKPLVYLDSAATAETPRSVIDAVARYEEQGRANVHRGIYALSEAATDAYEGAREKVRRFINARSCREIVFTRNTTEAINLVAAGLGKEFLKAGDHILISRAEHHSNFLPWQMLRDEKGIVLDVMDVDGEGTIGRDALERALHPQTKLAAFAHVLHVLGTINPIREWGALFRDRGVLFLVDAAQSVAHLPIDVQEIGCDFLAFSGHKMGGPMGIGVLYGREEILEKMPPFLRGGGMIREVTVEGATWDELPGKFEAGTPNVSGAIGLAAAINYAERVGFPVIRQLDEELGELIISRLSEVPGVKMFGPRNAAERGGVVSFTIEGVHPHDLATILDREGICIRVGHHCAMPLHRWLGVPATARASWWVYNTPADIESLIRGIEKALAILKPISK